MKNKLLELLTARCRDMGLTSKAIEELANLGSAGLAEDATEEDVASKVDSLIPFAKLAQAEITRKTRKVKSTEKQSDNEGEGEGTNQRDNEVPEWFKTQMESLTKQFETLKAENDKFKADNAKAENAVRELQLGIEDNNAEIAVLLQSLPKTVEKPNADLAIANNEEIKALQAEIDNLRQQVTAPTTNESKQQLISERDSINAVLRESQRQLAMADNNKRINDRIAELELQYRNQCEALAELERIEHIIEQFSKRKTEVVERKVNELFSVVKFKMFETLINGGEVETCVTTINGVPFADLNSASRINAGLDIINAISRHYDVVAPIFIDNAESINEIMHTQSQQVRLQVSKDTTLTIK